MRLPTRIGLIFALLSALQGCAGSGAGAPPPEAESAPTFADEYRIGIGDTLNVNVWRNEELSVSVPVRPDGRISIPLLGDVDVGGETPEGVAELIETQLADFVREPVVSIIVQSVGSSEYLTRVRVTGAVRQPVSVPYRPGMTVLDVILDAGGVRAISVDGTARPSHQAFWFAWSQFYPQTQLWNE